VDGEQIDGRDFDDFARFDWLVRGGRGVRVCAGAATGAAAGLAAGFRHPETVRYGVTAAPDFDRRLLRA
jgi:hypothetical protein